MASLNRQASVNGRASRASNASGRSRVAPAQPPSSVGDMFSNAAPGVFSMLKTSTDVGDIGEFSFNTSRLPATLRPAHQRRNHPSRHSGSSIHSTYTSHSRAPSQMSRRTSNAPNAPGWDTVSAVSSATGNGMGGRHGSMVSLQTLSTMPPYDGRAPPPRGLPKSSPYGPPMPYAQEGRSYSLTQSQQPPPLKSVKSAASLQSQGPGPFQPPRPPFAYPARLKRPGFRTPSPAFSDFAGGPYQIPYGPPQAFGEDAGYPIERPPSQMGLQYGPTYGHPQASVHGLPPGQPYGPPPGLQSGRGMHRPPMPTYNSDFPHVTAHVPRYPGHPPLPSRQHAPGNFVETVSYDYRGPPARPGAPYGIGGHEVAPRAGTPQMDSMPSSSERGSSAPQSSNPPTPRDATTVQVTLDPAFVDPALSELPDEQSDYKSVLSHIKYPEPSAVYELEAAQPAAIELEGSTPTMRTGLVKRIKHLLEDRAAGQENLPSNQSKPFQTDIPKRFVTTQQPKNDRSEPVELSASKRSSLHEPFELEVPARITRTLIKANTAPSSSEQNTTTSLMPDEAAKAQTDRKARPGTVQLQAEEPESTLAGGSAPHDSSAEGLGEETNTSSNLRQANGMDFAVHIELPGPPGTVSVPKHQQESDVEIQSSDHSEEPQTDCVSPLHSYERVVRDSIVSPMATPTIHITAIQDRPKLPGSFPSDMNTTESPRVPQSSRKVPESSELGSGFSFPPEPTQTHGTNPNSEPITDVAIKFSIPRTSDRGKAQLVNLSSLSETPVHASTETKKRSSAEGNTFQASFSSISKVGPLLVGKRESLSPIPSDADGTDLSSFIRRSFPRKKSMWSIGQADSTKVQSESTTDIGSSLARPLHGRLSGLKEDSKEDMSTQEHRSSTPGLGFPYSRTLNLKLGRESLRHSEDMPQSSYLTPRPPRMSLSELKNLPSLEFSRMNLVDRLNEALETRGARSSKSLEGVRREKVPGICPSSPLSLSHQASTEAILERYTSFFFKPNESEVTESCSEIPSQAMASEEGCTEEEQSTTEVARPHRDSTASSEVWSNYRLDRSYSHSVRPTSPKTMLSVAQEVNRLSIPSVAALSERLSELLPSIKHLQLDSAIANDKAIKDTIDEIHHLGRPGSDNTVLIRSSTGLRQMAAAADNIATNGTHDSALLEGRGGRLMKELPPLPEDTEKFSLSDSGLDRNTTFVTEGLTSTELEPPKPALLRGKSLSVIDSKDDEFHPGFPRRRSLILSSQSLRPWNQDENYPWCGNSPAINITFPTPVLRRNSSASEVIRNTSGISSKTEDDTGDTVEPESTLHSSPIVSSGDVVTPTMTGHGRMPSKKSLIGSLSRKMGLSTRSQSRSAARESALAERAYKSGDRYPNTSLQPPHSFNIEEVRSFFSDSTSEGHGDERRGSFRKQITSFRSRLPNHHTASLQYSQSLDVNRTRSLDQHGQASHTNATGSLFDDRFTEPVTPQNYDGMVGMGRMEFRVKRVAERLRHIWVKGGEIIRSLSQRNRPGNRRQHGERVTDGDDWLADSLYSNT